MRQEIIGLYSWIKSLNTFFPTTMTSLILFDIWCLSTKGIRRSILISFFLKILWTWPYSQTNKVIFFGLMADSWKIMSNDLVRIWFSAVLWVVDGPTRRGDTTQGVMWLVMVEGLQVLPWQLCLLHVASFQKIQSQIARYIKIGEYASIHPNLWWIIFMFISRFKSGTNFLKCFKRYNQFNLTNP